MLTRQMFEGFGTGGYDGRLPVHNGGSFQPRRVREITRRPSRGCREPRVGFNLHLNALRVSGHGRSPGARRRLPGNPDSSRGHPHPSARCADLCKSCSISRRCSALPACRTSRKGRDRAWEPPRKTVPDDGEARQGARFFDAASCLPGNSRLAERFFSPTSRFSLALSASLTSLEAHASIDFCPEPPEWKQPTRPPIAKPAKRR